ncbi:MAG TPA: lytic transglycosylase domain-containing protein [Gemmatimonadaceae bacterium]|nr:lytic transglycosylase domain-containing protein [Gemmatimonadaceae bacterium]
MQLRSIAIAGALCAVAGGMLVGHAGHAAPPVKSARPFPAAEMRVSPVVVVAKRPTVNEILDLILGDRGDSRTVAVNAASGTALPAGSEEARIAALLRKRTPDADRANRVAAALVREARRANIGATLLIGVLLTENPDLEPRATSSVGARGLMQVMPFHAGKWGCSSSDLFDIDANICHGVQILADNLKRSRNLPTALQRYNGCVRGTNTPDCHRYAGKVYRSARRTAVGLDGKVTALTPFSSLN